MKNKKTEKSIGFIFNFTPQKIIITIQLEITLNMK